MTTCASGCAGFVMMLTQTGSPSRAVHWRFTVGIRETAVTPHTGNRVRTVLGVTGTTEVYLSKETDVGTAVAVVTAAADVRIAQVGVVETASPAKVALSHRDVAFVIPEASVALSAPSPLVPVI
jgi:hypothetical protein